MSDPRNVHAPPPRADSKAIRLFFHALAGLAFVSTVAAAYVRGGVHGLFACAAILAFLAIFLFAMNKGWLGRI